MKIEISPDKLKATLIFGQNDSSVPALQDVQKLFDELGIKAPILTKEFDKLKQSDIDIDKSLLIAEGTAPETGSPNVWEVVAKALESEDKIVELENWMKEESDFHFLVKQKFPVYEIVKNKDLIAKFILGDNGKKGKDVMGSDILPPKLEASILEWDKENIEWDEAKENLIAKNPGLLIKRGDKLQILKVNAEFKAEVILSEDKMNSTLSVFPPLDEKQLINSNSILDLLENYGIVHGIKRNVVNTFGSSLKNSKHFPFEIMIAEGSVPKEGVSKTYRLTVDPVKNDRTIEKLEVLSKSDTNHFLTLKKDFPDLQMVSEKTSIGSVIPQIEGIPGRDVLGSEIKFDYIPSEMPQLDTNSISTNDQEKSLSTIKAGILVCKNDQISVIPFETNLKIEIEKSKDNMQGHIIIYPNIDYKISPTRDMIDEKIKSEGVVNGILEENISKITDNWNSKSTFPLRLQIAQGKSPIEGKAKSFKWKNNPISEPKLIESIEKHIKEYSSHHFLLKKNIAGISVFEKKEVLGEIVPEIPSKPGMDIIGNPINMETPKYEGDKIEKNSIIINKNQFNANVSGVFINSDDFFRILPISTDHKLELEISEDKLIAKLSIYPSSGKTKNVDHMDIKRLLVESNIKFGINENFIKNLEEQVKTTKEFPMVIDIAKGIPSIEGEDGKVNYLIELESDFKPLKDSSGQLNYKDIKTIEVVKKGQKLAKLIPPTKGKKGTDIYGKEIIADDGTPTSLPIGANTYVGEKQQDILFSSLDGIVNEKDSLLNVNEGYVIDGSVDYSTGNVFYDKSVIVKNDVKSGFSVYTNGDLEIGGIVEDANLKAVGNVVVKGGFTGKGEGWIRSGNDVSVKYINSKSIFAKGDIFIQGESLQSHLTSEGTIHCLSSKISFTGGDAFAWKGMEVEVLGSPSGSHGSITLGWNYRAHNIISEIDHKITELDKKLHQLESGLNQLENIKQVKKTLTAELEKTLNDIKLNVSKMQGRKKNLKNRINRVKKKYGFCKEAALVVKKKAYPGITLVFGNVKYVINSECGPGKFRLQDDEIVFHSGT